LTKIKYKNPLNTVVSDGENIGTKYGIGEKWAPV